MITHLLVHMDCKYAPIALVRGLESMGHVHAHLTANRASTVKVDVALITRSLVNLVHIPMNAAVLGCVYSTTQRAIWECALDILALNLETTTHGNGFTIK